MCVLARSVYDLLTIPVGDSQEEPTVDGGSHASLAVQLS